MRPNAAAGLTESNGLRSESGDGGECSDVKAAERMRSQAGGRSSTEKHANAGERQAAFAGEGSFGRERQQAPQDRRPGQARRRRAGTGAGTRAQPGQQSRARPQHGPRGRRLARSRVFAGKPPRAPATRSLPREPPGLSHTAPAARSLFPPRLGAKDKRPGAQRVFEAQLSLYLDHDAAVGPAAPAGKRRNHQRRNRRHRSAAPSGTGLPGAGCDVARACAFSPRRPDVGGACAGPLGRGLGQRGRGSCSL